MEERESKGFTKILRTVGEESPLNKVPRNLVVGYKTRRTGSTGPKGGTTAPHKNAHQRLEEKTRGTGTSGKRTGSSG